MHCCSLSLCTMWCFSRYYFFLLLLGLFCYGEVIRERWDSDYWINNLSVAISQNKLTAKSVLKTERLSLTENEKNTFLRGNRTIIVAETWVYTHCEQKKSLKYIVVAREFSILDNVCENLKFYSSSCHIRLTSSRIIWIKFYFPICHSPLPTTRNRILKCNAHFDSISDIVNTSRLWYWTLNCVKMTQ